jgi:hypothetical protein
MIERTTCNSVGEAPKAEFVVESQRNGTTHLLARHRVDLASCSSYISTPVYVVFKQLSLIIVILLRIENSLFRGYCSKNSYMDTNHIA